MHPDNCATAQPWFASGARWLVLFCLAAGGAPAAPAGLFPKGTNLASIEVISDAALENTAQRVLIATLQGLVARQSSNQIYIDGGSGYSIWDGYLTARYGIPRSTVTSPWPLISQFKGLVAGYILYDYNANTNSLDAANCLCGPSNAVAVDASIEATVRAYGITNRLADVRTVNDQWVWTNDNAAFSRNVVIEQKESFADNLRDYATMANTFIFFDGNSPFRNYVMTCMNPNSACLGWGDASEGESVFVGDSSANGVFTVASDWALDLSTLSSITDPSICQHTYSIPAIQTGVHYVAFLMTDGDNVQENLGSLPGFFNSPARGSFNMGWALSPSLADLAPAVLRWYFESASNGAGRDFFVAGPSGVGYFYPSQLPAAALALQTQALSDYMSRADLNIAQVIDFNSFTNAGVWNQYLSQPAIDALIYEEYSQYDQPFGSSGGQIYFSTNGQIGMEQGTTNGNLELQAAAGPVGQIYFSTNGRPILSPTDLLWGGLESSGALLTNINQGALDPSSPSGYSLALFHYGDSVYANLSSLRSVVTNLASTVRVVTPDQYVKLIRANIGRKLAYDFGFSLQGWVGAISGKPYDKAIWTGTIGDPPGALELDGSDLGVPDSDPNSWFARQIILPANAATLSFNTCADANTHDGLLRVRLLQPNGTFVTLLNWEQLTNGNWVSRTADISAYAGQTVIFYFEQNDGGMGSGEFRYVDNVSITAGGAPVWLPDAPRLLYASNRLAAVTLQWRDNDNNESGFIVQRRLGADGLWTQIASLATNITTWVDVPVSMGTNYSYRVQSWNAAGASLYSNTQTVNTSPVPALSIAKPGGQLVLTWPSWATNFGLYSATNFPASNSWQQVTNSPALFGSNFTVSVAPGPPSRFFVLIAH